MTDRSAALRRSLRLGLPALVILAVIAVLALRAVSAAGAETDRYSTATVGRGSISETYAGSGTVAKTNQESVTFPVSGRVTGIKVAVGDKVRAGQVLATMDDTALELAVAEAKQALADAQVTLDNADAAAEASASAAASPSASPSPSPPAPPASSSRPSSAANSRATSDPNPGPNPGPNRSVQQLRQAVTAAQAALTRLNVQAATALAAQQVACGPFSTGPVTATPTASPTDTPTSRPTSTGTPTATPTGTPTPTGTATATPTATPAPTPSGTSSGSMGPSASAPSATSSTPSASPTTTSTATPTPSATPVESADPAMLSACIAAVIGTQRIQLQVAHQQTLTDQAVTALVAAVAPTGNPSASSSPGGTPTGQHATAGKSDTGATGQRTTGPASSAGPAGGGRGGQAPVTVGSAEAAVTKAETALATAEARLAAATMTAPIDGVVSALPFAKGDTAGTSDAAVIIGKGAVKVVMNVTEAAFRTLKVGMPATISTAGGGAATGRVTMRGLLPTQSTGTGSAASGSGATTFPVTVIASGQDAARLAAGDTASVRVTLNTRADVIVVPVSAVTRDDTDASVGTVQVLQNGAVTRTRVGIGAIGTATVEITEGVQEGQTLVIADNSTALPTTSSNRLRTGGGGAVEGAPGGPPAGGGAPPGGR